MPVPDYQSLMLPFLKTIRDKREHTFGDIADTLAKEFHLTEAEKKEILPSGIQTRFDNRVGWVRTYLKKAELLESTGRGKFRITERGLQILNSNPTEINIKFLRQFPEFLDFQKSSRQENKSVLIDGEQLTQLMIDYSVGVAELTTYTVKKIDLDYFDEE